MYVYIFFQKMMINKKERIWLAIVTFLILVYSSIPNWVGYAAETETLSYKGAFFDPQDYAVHISMLRAGMQGDWAYRFRFTTEPHTIAYTRMFYIILGQINRVLHLSPIILFEIARWFFGALALLSLYALASRVFEELWWRRIAFLLAVFASGLGWMQLMMGWNLGTVTPIDFWLIDAYVFFGLALFPHFAFVTALLCLAFAFYLDFLFTANWKRFAWVGAFALFVQFVNPIAFMLVDITFLVATIAYWVQKEKIEKTQLLALGGLAILQVPLLLYNFMLLTFDPVWSQFTQQNQTLSPPLFYYLWGFGLLWIFALVGGVFAFRHHKIALIASTAWVLVGLALAYAPFPIQRRFLHGITIPLAFLGTQGLMTFSRFILRKTPFGATRIRILIGLTIFLLSFSSIYLVLGRSLCLFNHPDEYYYDNSLDYALDWLQENATPNDFVISTAPSGQLIAQNTELRVYLGHEAETLKYAYKSQLIDTFYRGEADTNWLVNADSAWVLYGPYEQRISLDNKIYSLMLEKKYQYNDVIIYHVVR